MMRGCLRLIAGLFVILFVVTAVAALFAVNLIQVATDREIIKGALQDVDALVLDIAPTLIAQALREQAQAQGLPPIELDEAVLEEVVTDLIPPDWISTQAGTAVDALFDVLETGDTAATGLEINARPFLERLQGPPGERVIRTILQSLPTCTEPLPEVDLEADSIEVPDCLPPGVDIEETTELVHTAVVKSLAQNPQFGEQAEAIQIPLFSEVQLQSDQQEQLQQIQRGFRLVQRWHRLLWLIPLGCLFVILILAVRSLAGFGRWWGWPLVVTAVITFLLAFVAPFLLTALIRTAGSQAISSTIIPGDQLVRSITDFLTDLWLRRVYIQAGLMLAVGLLLVIIGFIRQPKQRELV